MTSGPGRTLWRLGGGSKRERRKRDRRKRDIDRRRKRNREKRGERAGR